MVVTDKPIPDISEKVESLQAAWQEDHDKAQLLSQIESWPAQVEVVSFGHVARNAP